MHTIKQSTKTRFTILVVLVASLSHTAQAQCQKDVNSTKSYLLDNFKCCVHIGSAWVNDKFSKVPFSSFIQGGLNLGYYFLKSDLPRPGYIKKKFVKKDNLYEHVSVDVGKKLASLEIGIQYPEKRFINYIKAFQIKETLIVFPVILQWAVPDFFFKETYTALFLGYHAKYLISATYTPTKGSEKLVPIAALKNYNNINTLFHNIILGVNTLGRWGFYLAVGYEIPISCSNTLDTYTGTQSSSRVYNDFRYSIVLGVDIIMMLRSYYGLSFSNPNRKREIA